jgi:hypothetical protein
LDILFREVLEGVDFLDRLHKDAMEDVVNTGATQTLDSALFNELAFDHVSIGVREPTYQIKDDRTLVSLDGETVGIELDYL